jgi:thiosulfate/3-mercaptopyruvate sulfurtransferase
MVMKKISSSLLNTENQQVVKTIYLFVILALGSFMFFMPGCSSEKGDDMEEVDDLEAVASCEGCHTNYEHLQKVFSPDTEAPAGGCSGDAPHFEPYDRVYMGGEGYEAFKLNAHYEIGCVGCHNGTDKTSDKLLAHSGNFISHPSAEYQDKCGKCHSEIAKNFVTSIHNGTGQKRKVAIRSGFTGSADFSKLPASHQEGYNKNCATCHGTCGNCHVVRPLAGGGGLANGHNFTKSPDMINTCVVCHSSRGGHAYLGVGSGTQPDVHLANKSFECKSCHSGAELHGDGEPVEQRYAYSKLPTCNKCHENVASSNTWHKVHADDFNCQVCHSQDYNNCGSCHIHGEGARVPSYMGYKIAVNPLPDIKSEYKFALVRRTLAAPDNWKEYGVEEYANFNALPTYNYTTPHNILRWTTRTKDTGGSCSSNCHIKNDGGTLVNKQLFLFEEDLLDWEKEATKPITVDSKLPSKWFEQK